MHFQLLVLLFAMGAPKAAENGSRGDAKDTFTFFGGYDDDDYGDTESKGTFEKVQQYETSLLLLFNYDNLTQKVYSYLNKSSAVQTIDSIMATFYVELAVKKEPKYSELDDMQKTDIANVLDILLQSINGTSTDPDFTIPLQTIIKEGVKLTDIVTEQKVVDMIEYLNTAMESDDGNGCPEYSGNLVAFWIDIVEAHDDSSIHDHMTNLMNIQCAMENADCRVAKVQNKINLMSLLSTERNSKFTSEALGGMQQLEDFIQDIICKDIGLKTFDDLLSNLSSAGKLTFDSPETMQTFVEMQQGLLEITSKVISDTPPLRNGGVRTIQGRSLGQAILSSYMELADKAMSPEKADVWAKMTLEDANAQLNKLLISNEHYVGELSRVVVDSNDNFTIDKETVTVTLSKMSLAGNMSIQRLDFRV